MKIRPRNLILLLIAVAMILLIIILVSVNFLKYNDVFTERYDSFEEAVASIEEISNSGKYFIITDDDISYIEYFVEDEGLSKFLVKSDNGKYYFKSVSFMDGYSEDVVIDNFFGRVTILKVTDRYCVIFDGRPISDGEEYNDFEAISVTDSLNSDFKTDIIDYTDYLGTNFQPNHIWFKTLDEIPEGYELKINDTVVYVHK